MTKGKSCWCAVRRVKQGPNKGAIGDMVCATSKRAVRDMSRFAVKRGLDAELTKPRIKKSPKANCG
jgi:hypothetical protein